MTDQPSPNAARRCDMETCPYWTGDGCACAVLDIEPSDLCTRPGCGQPKAEHDFGVFCP